MARPGLLRRVQRSRRLAPGLRARREGSDACFDAQGFLLEEAWVLDGRRVRRRVAVAIDTAPDAPGELFDVPDDPTVGVEEGGGLLRRLDPGSRPPGEFTELSVSPEGLTHEGRYAVTWPQGGGASNPVECLGARVATVVDVWTRGIDVVFVERGGTVGGTLPPLVSPNGEVVDLGALGPGELVLDLRSTDVRVVGANGELVRVYGTVDPSTLVRVARSLTPVPGGTLRPVDS